MFHRSAVYIIPLHSVGILASNITDCHAVGVRDLAHVEYQASVPNSHILYLENRNATRSAIISTLESHFLNNPAIADHGNTTLLFYFAGHGSRVESPGNILAADGKIEVLCPSDERTFSADGKYVPRDPQLSSWEELLEIGPDFYAMGSVKPAYTSRPVSGRNSFARKTWEHATSPWINVS
ncbi:hypothetical protein B0H14DRAFT_3885047 [Mycena olivaceomarginata]|nr:hypothetical protein B0H14DRAFT_3885047 [Mycena olivaceomarginata]